MIEGLLLDLDGTLADSLPALRRAYERFLENHACEASEAEWAEINGPTLREIVGLLASRHDLAAPVDRLHGEYLALVEEFYASASLLQHGARELLAAAADRGILLGVVTAAPRALAEAFLSAHGVAGAFACLVTGDDVEEGKPSPRGYQEGLARLGLAAEGVVAVEDSPRGAQAARAAGLRTFLLVDPKRGAPDGVPAEVERIQGLAELVPLVRGEAL